MPQNPYESSIETADLSTVPPSLSIIASSSLPGSMILVLLGLAVAGLGFSPSDAPNFFLLTGAHLVGCGILGATCVWIQRPRVLGQLLCWISLAANVTLAFRIVILIVTETVRGPLVIAVPLLLGLPSILNAAAAVLYLRDHLRHPAKALR